MYFRHLVNSRSARRRFERGDGGAAGIAVVEARDAGLRAAPFHVRPKVERRPNGGDLRRATRLGVGRRVPDRIG